MTTTFDVDRTDDTAAATACTAAANDCSLRGAIIAANADVSANPVIINLQPATTYNLTLTNATQENAAATGDLDITTNLHTITIAGAGASTIIDAAGLNTGTLRDRAFHVTGPGVTVIFQGLVIQNGQADDDGTSGASTNPTAQNSNRFGGGILNNGGSVTLTNVIIQSCQALGKGDSVVNDRAPVITLNGQTITLWPPNHKYKTVKVTDLVASARDLCDPTVGIGSVRIASVSSDEPNNSGGDGNTTNDIVIAADCKSVQLRSDRMGGSNGRVYTITFNVTDASGNVGTATAKVTVPHSQNGSAAVDDGPNYTVLSGCP